jgi:PPOX class probable F420-dependent enzyme
LTEIPEPFRQLVKAPGVAILATNGADGYPHVSAVWYLLDDDGAVKISLNSSRQKTKNLQRDPRCTLFFLDPATPYRTLEMRADAEVTLDPDNAFAVRFGAAFGADVRENDRPGESRVIVTLHPVKINTFGA